MVFNSTFNSISDISWLSVLLLGEKLSIRREQRKLVLFYKITQGQCPEYLTDLMPPLVSESTNYNL